MQDHMHHLKCNQRNQGSQIGSIKKYWYSSMQHIASLDKFETTMTKWTNNYAIVIQSNYS